MLRPAQRRLLLLSAAFALSFLSCGREVTGPDNGINYGNRIASLSLAPQMPSLMSVLEGAGDAVPFDRVRVLLRNQDGSVAKDTTVIFPAGADSVALSLQIPLPLSAPDSGLPLALTMAYVNAAGDTVFRGGPNPIVARPVGRPGANVPVVIPVTYEGTGKDATSVAISPKTGSGVAGGTQAFAGTAFNDATPIPNTPFLFYTLDSARAQVNAVTGVATWLPNRGVARVVAALPNGLRADTATFSISLPASKLVLQAGGSQTGAINAPLTDTIVVRTLASDDVPVAGVTVAFAVATGGGSVATINGVSDSLGRVRAVWTLGGTLGAQSITATSPGLTFSPLTINATAVAGTPTQLVIASQPTIVTAGAGFTPPIVVEARDAFGNVATSFTGEISLAINGPNPPPFGGITAKNAIAGVASFDAIDIKVVGTYELRAMAGALVVDTTAPIQVVAAAAAELQFLQQPVGAVAGDNFLPPVTVRALDAFGNPASGFTGPVSLALLNGGAATLRGTLTQNAVAGLATFSDLNVREVGGGYALHASSGVLLPDTSSAFGITPSLPAQLVIVGGDAQTGAVLTTLADSLRVEVRDLYSNPVPGATVNFVVTSGGGTLSASSAVSGADGRAAVRWTLGNAVGAQSVDAALAVAPAVSVAFGATATVGTPAQVVITSAPTTGVAGAGLSLIAEVRDSLGNRVTSYTGQLTLALDANPGSATLGGTTLVNAMGGIGTFAGWVITTAASGYTLRVTAVTESIVSAPSAPFTITAASGGATQLLSFSGGGQTVTAGAAFPQPLQVQVLDIYGNPLSGHPTTWSDNGVVTLGTVGVVLTDSNGVATNTAVAGTVAGAQNAGPSVTTTGTGTSVVFGHIVEPGVATQIAFISQPDTVVAGEPFPPTLFVEIRDSLGNRVVSFNDSVSVTIDSGPALSALLGPTTQFITIGGGPAGQFAGLEIEKAGTYRLRATAPSGITGVSAPLVVVPAIGFLAMVEVSGMNDTGVVNQPFAEPIRVRVQDAYANPAPGIAVAWFDQGGGAILSADTVLTDANGIAEVLATHPSTPVALSAVSAQIVGRVGTRDFFYTTTVGTVDSIAIVSGNAQSVAVGDTVAAPLVVEVRDQFGNLVSGASVAFEIVAGAVSLTEFSATTDALGRASTRVIAGSSAGTFAIAATVGVLPDTVLFTGTVTAGAPIFAEELVGPVNGTAGVAMTPFTYVVKDAFGNVASGFNGTAFVTLSPSTVNDPTPVVTGGDTVAVVNGVATWSSLTVTSAGSFTLLATLGSNAVNSNTFTIEPAAPAQLLKVAGDSQSVAVGNFLPQLLEVRVTDAFGNGVAGVNVNFNTISGFATPNVPTVATDGAGLAAASIAIDSIAGPVLIGAYAAGLTPDSVLFTATGLPGAPSGFSLVAGDAQTVTAGGVAADTIRVRLKDAFGNGIAGATVVFASFDDVTFTADTVITDASGIASTVAIAPPSIGLKNFFASLPGVSDFYLTMDVTSAAASVAEIVSAPTFGTAGATLDPLVVQLKDIFGNTANGATDSVFVEIASGPGGATLSGPTRITAAGGVATFSGLSSTTAGEYRLRVFGAGISADTTDAFTVANDTAAFLTYISGDAQSMAPTATAADSLVVRVTDTYGNPVPNVGISWGVAPGTAVVSSSFVLTDSSGISRIALTASQFAESGTVTAVNAGLTGSPVAFTYNTTAGAAAQVVLVVPPANTTAGTPINVQARVEDSFGNTTSGFTDTITVSVDSGPANPVITGPLAVAAVNGVADFTGLVFETAGEYRLRVSPPAASGVPDAVSSLFTVSPAAAAVLSIADGNAQTVEAGTLAAVLLKALLTDVYGNPIEAEVIDWTVISGDIGLGAASTGTDFKGEATVGLLSNGTAGAYSVRAVSAVANDTVLFTGTVTASAAWAFAPLSGNAQVTGAGVTAADSIVVRLIDVYGNGIAGATVNFTTPDDITFSPTSATTDAEGLVRTTVTGGPTLGLKTITLTSPPAIDVNLNVTVEAGPATALSIVAEPTAGIAGQTLAPGVAVYIVDAFGNTVTTATNSVTLQLDSSLTVGPLNGTLTQAAVPPTGFVSFDDLSLETAGSYRLIVRAAGLAPDTTGTFTVGAATPDTVQEGAGNGQLMTAGGDLTTPLSVRVVDAFGNPVPGASVFWNVAQGSATLDSAETTTDADGYAYATIGDAFAAESLTVTAQGPVGDPIAFLVIVAPSAPVQLAMVVQPSDVAALETIPAFSVEVRDQFDNRVLSFSDSVFLQIEQAPVMASVTGTRRVEAVGGLATFSDISANRIGTYRFRFQSNNGAVADTTSDAITVSAAAATVIIAGRTETQSIEVLAVSDTIGAQVQDAAGNPVSGVSVTWTFPAGLDSLFATGVTDADGYALAVVRGGSVVGDFVVTASAAGLTGSPVNFTVTLVPGAATQLRIVSAPDTVPAGTPGAVWEVEAADSVGNRVTSYTGNVSVTVNAGPGALSGTSTVAAVAGVATFNDLSFVAIGNYTLAFTDGVLAGVLDSTTVKVGATASIEIAQGDAQSGFATLPLAQNLAVIVRDGVSNFVPGDTVVWTVEPGTNGGLINGSDSTITVTNEFGSAVASFKAGTTVGVQSVRARASNGSFVQFDFTIGALLGNAIWTGDADTVWTNTANWYGGNVPTAGDSVHVLSGRPNYPVLSSNVSMTKLFVEDGVIGFAIGDNSLEVSGDFRAPQGGAFTIGGFGQIRVTGSGTHTIRGALPRLTIENGQYSVNEDAGATWSVFGDLSVTQNARLILDAADSVFVTGNFLTTTGGQLAQAAGSDLFVFGDAQFGGGSTAGLLTGGQLTVAGDFTTLGGEPQAFQASASHETRFIGGSQIVSFISPDNEIASSACFASCFGRVIADSLAGSDTLRFTSTVKARAGFQVSNNALLADGQRVIASDASSLLADSVRIGTIVFIDEYPTFAPDAVLDSIHASGTGLLPDSLTAPTVVFGNRELRGWHNASLSVAGQLVIGSGTAVITGTLRTINNSGSIRMLEDGDTLTVLGDALFAGFGNQAHLTAGVLRVAGNFDAAASTFIASGTHRTELIGSSSTQVGMASPGFTTSSNHFQFFWLRKTDGAAVATTTPLAIQGQLIATEPGQAIFGTGLSNAVSMYGASITALRLNNQPLILRGDGIVSVLDSLRFENFDANLTQLRIERETLGAPLNAPVFDTLATNPTYLALVDPTDVDPTLVVEVNDPRPAYRGTFVSVGPGATLVGWSQFPAIVWGNVTGNRNWADPDNWLQFVAPTATDSVVVPSGFDAPIINAATTVRALVSTNNLPIELNAALTVRGRLNLSAVEATTISCGAGGSIRLDGTSGAVPVGGEVACDVAVGTPGAFTASDFRSGTLRMEDGGDFTLGAYTLTVTGELIATNGTLRMNDDFGVAVVEGAATFASPASGSPALTAGVLQFSGAFTQSGAADAFQPEGTHVVEFDGAAPQSITFANPASSSAGSFFNRLRFNTDAATVELGSDVYARGAVEQSLGNMILSSPGTVRTLYSVGANVTAASFDNVRWVVDSASSIANLSGVAFSGLEGDGAQLRLRGISGSANIEDIVFDTTDLVAGDVYLAAEDPDGGLNGSLQVFVTNPIPVVHGGRILQDGGVISGWDEILTFVWDGSENNVFTNPANWVLGVAPSPSDSVFIPSPPSYSFFPAITNGSVNVRALVSEDSVNAITIDGVSLLQVTERAVFAGDGGGVSCAPGGQFLLTNVASISGRINGCDLRINGGLVSVTDSVIVGDNLLVLNDAVFNINGAVVRVDGNFAALDSSLLVMDAADDSLLITGTASFSGGDQTGLLTDGYLEVRAGFNGTGTNEFVASGSHRTRLGGATLDYYALSDNNGDLRFGRLELQPENFQVARTITAGFLLQPNGGSLVLDTLSGNRLIVQNDYQGSTTSAVDALVLEIGGSLLTNGLFGVDTVRFIGTSQELRAYGDTGVRITYQRVEVAGNVHVRIPDGDSLVVTSLGVLDGGLLNFDDAGPGTAVTRINGAFRTDGSGSFSMQESSTTVRVLGDAVFAGGSTDGQLTAGQLQLYGDFTQLGLNSPESFRALPGHFTYFFSDEVAATVSFASPSYDAGGSRFGFFAHVPTAGPTSVVLASDVFAYALLYTGVTPLEFQAPELERYTLHTQGVELGKVGFRRLDLEVTAGALNIYADSVNFSESDPEGTPLRIARTGGSYTIDTLVFETLPTTGRYLRLEDTDTNGDPVTLAIIEAIPGYYGSYVDLIGEATLSGWEQSGPAVWTGAVNDDFSVAGNWLALAVPTAADSVTIPAAFSGNIFVYSPTTIGALAHLSSGATLELNDLLTVNGTFNTGGNPMNCAAGAAVLLANATMSATDLATTTFCDVTIGQGPYRVAANSAVQNLTVSGDATLDLDGHTLVADQNFEIIDSAAVVMDQAADTLRTNGDGRFTGRNTFGLLTAGSIEVFGDFTNGGSSAGSFISMGGQRVVLGDSTIGIPQNRSLTFTAGDSSYFHNLYIANHSYTLIGDIRANGLIRLRQSTELLGGAVVADSGLFMGTEAVMSLDRLAVRGNFFPTSSFSADTVDFLGPVSGVVPQTVPPLSSGYQRMRVFGAARVSSISQSVAVTEAIEVNGGALEVQPQEGAAVINLTAPTADLIVTNGGTFAMRTDGTVNVDSAHFDGASTAGLLKAGLLRVGGALVQLATSSPSAFRADSTLTVELIDSVTVSLATPDSARFQNLKFGDASTVILLSDINVDGELRRETFSSLNHRVESDVKTTAPPRRITVTGGVDFSGGSMATEFANVSLRLVDDSNAGGGSYSFSNITFMEMDPASLYLDLTGFENYFTIVQGVNFSTPVTTGRYFEIPATTTIAFQSSSPTIGCIGAPDYCVGPRSEPSAGVDTNTYIALGFAFWSDSSAWSLGHPPRSYEDVLINDVSPYLDAGATRYARNLTVTAGPDIFADPGAVLEIRGDFTNARDWFGDNGATIRFRRNADTGPTTIDAGGRSIDDFIVSLDSNMVFGVDSVVLASPLQVGSNGNPSVLRINAGVLDVNGQWLEVDSLFTTGTGSLRMANASDSVRVNVMARFEGGSSNGRLTDGKLVVVNALTQAATNTAFAASGNHQTIVEGNGSLTFANPGVTESHVARLRQSGAGVVTLGSHVVATGDLYLLDGATTYLGGGATNRELQVAGLSTVAAGVVTFDNVRVRVVDAGSVSLSQQPVTFQNMDPSVDFLTFDRSGGSVGLPNLVFNTTPSGPGRFLVAKDTVFDASALTLNIDLAQPSAHGNLIATLGEASIVGWDPFAQYVFTGASATDGSVFDPANWDVGVVPTYTSTVRLGGSATRVAEINSNTQYRTVFVDPGQDVSVTASVTVGIGLYMSETTYCSSSGEFVLQPITGTSQIGGLGRFCNVRLQTGDHLVAGQARLGRTIVENGARLFPGSTSGPTSLTVNDSLVVLAGGSVLMNADVGSDSLIMNGVLRADAGSTVTFAAGALVIRSDARLNGNVVADSGAHVYLGDDLSATERTLTIANSNVRFDSVTVNFGTQTVDGSLRVGRFLGYNSAFTGILTGDSVLVGRPGINDGTLALNDSARVTTDVVVLAGELTGPGLFQPDTTVFAGRYLATQDIPATNSAEEQIQYRHVLVTGDARMGAGLGAQSYRVLNGLRVTDSLTISSIDDSVIVDVDGQLHVTGLMAVGGDSTRLRADNVLLESPPSGGFELSDAAVMEVEGSYEVRPVGGQAVPIAYDTTSTVRMLGSGVLDVSGLHTGANRFGRLEFVAGEEVTILGVTQTRMLGRRSGSSGQITLRSLSSGSGFNLPIVTAGLDFPSGTGELLLNNVRLQVEGDFAAPNYVFNDARFAQMDPEAVFLLTNINGTGSLTFTNISFDSPVTGAGRYYANFGFGGSGNPSVTFVNASPAVDCLADTCNPFDEAPISGGSFATFTAAADTNWTNPANWDGGVVPNANTEVTIPTGTMVLLAESRQVKSLTVESGAQVWIAGGQTLTVWGDLTADGAILNSAGNVVMRHVEGGSTLQAPVGFVPRLQIQPGLGGIEDTVRLTGNVIKPATDPTRGTQVYAGVLDIGQYTLADSGSFFTENTGRLRMQDPAGLVRVKWNLIFRGGSTDSLLTAGTVEFSGFFEQDSVNSHKSFVATGSHLVRFVGPITQDITMRSSSPTLSRFANVEINKPVEGTVDIYEDSAFVQNLVGLNGGMTIAGGSFIVLDSVSNIVFDSPSSSDAIAMVGTGVLELRGVDPATCDGFQFNVSFAKSQFRPSACHTTWVADASPTSEQLNAVTYVGDSTVVAVGNNGVVLRKVGNGAWTPLVSGTSENLLAIGSNLGGGAFNEFWVTGTNGTVIRYTAFDTVGVALASGTSTALRGVTWDNVNGWFVVGDGGFIQLWNGSGWISQTSNTTADLYGIGNSFGQGIIAYGTSGEIVLYTGTSGIWAPLESPTSNTLRGFFSGYNETWHVGDLGSFVQKGAVFDTTRTLVASVPPITTQLNGVGSFGDQFIYAVGMGGALLRRELGQWTPIASGTAANLYGVTVNVRTTLADAYAVGAGGVILRAALGEY